MRNFWISYKCYIKGGHIEGDVVADMPDDAKLTAEWLRRTMYDIRSNILAKLTDDSRRKAEMLKTFATANSSTSGLIENPVQVGQVIVLAVIPLEG